MLLAKCCWSRVYRGWRPLLLALLLQMLLGLVFGPLAYWTGAKMGAAEMPTAGALLVIGLAWALAFRAIMLLADTLSPGHAVRRR